MYKIPLQGQNIIAQGNALGCDASALQAGNFQPITKKELMNMKNYHFALILFLLFAVGCGGNYTVSGKITFPDDTPLTEGTVFFSSGDATLTGTINEDGTFSMTSGELKGVPKGTYAVSLGFQTETIISSGQQGVPPTVIKKPLPFDEKYLFAERSGLVCEVKGKTKFDIKVEKP